MKNDSTLRNSVVFALFVLFATAAVAQPTVEFASYMGGTEDRYSFGDTLRDVDIATDGSFYMAGGTPSPDYPVKNAWDSSIGGVHDIAVAKFNSNYQLLWSTFLGGGKYDRAYAIELGPNDSVYVCGRAGAGFPTTPGVVQKNFGGDINVNPQYGQQDGLVAKLSSSGQLIWATYIGVLFENSRN